VRDLDIVGNISEFRSTSFALRFLHVQQIPKAHSLNPPNLANHTGFSVGSICSGSESPILSLRQLGKALKLELGVTFKWEHLFSTELHDKKRELIGKLFSVPYLFKDAEELSQRQAKNYRYSPETSCTVPHPKCVIAGFPCLDSSGLNMHSKTKLSRTPATGRLSGICSRLCRE